jgi:haloacetate dehalogenase
MLPARRSRSSNFALQHCQRFHTLIIRTLQAGTADQQNCNSLSLPDPWAAMSPRREKLPLRARMSETGPPLQVGEGRRMFAGFEARRVAANGTEIFLRVKGGGEPLLLLHGYPQTHAMWHAIAPALAERFTVVCADLRGYGDSGKPASGPDHAAYAKRTSAQDMVEVMTALGFERFMAAGHDRGGRVVHRLCLDCPERVTRAAVLDIVPTRTVFRATDQALATGYYHWFFLIQPEPLPERLIGADPSFYLREKLARWSTAKDTSWVVPEALAEYERCFADPATIHATCEDYRAAASIDLAHDEADLDRKIACPLLVLWGEQGLMHRHFDVLATWREKALGSVEGRALPCGHFLAEERPTETLEALRHFFAAP